VEVRYDIEDNRIGLSIAKTNPNEVVEEEQPGQEEEEDNESYFKTPRH
jgi:hypothetical protein